MTKIILIQDVPNLGQKFDLIEVEDAMELLSKRQALAWLPTTAKRFAGLVKDPSSLLHP